MRKGRALAEGHQSSIWRFDSDTDTAGQFFGHLVSNGIGTCLQDFILCYAAVRLDIGTRGCNCVISEIRSSVNDADFVSIFYPTHLLDDVTGIHKLGLRRTELHLCP